ncbi:TetR/AcrR family transcriptional regulator C-terminal domain-containing protein [Afifella sp. H1R]|uniref:TetR/AcrR family transcriptional regulator n=1 Tax=Afifella sp. H1R TaxID=2908841 RepID=UPI001F22E66F|nr:TetR/AcrR family transcriptional regulator C-terminal domain-containing protein [Afifella sp. H1R]MCF1503802.1 TetR/AcrR family transcriptional regulator C-terminal domain-containing protein [Afifella sp. H1R]
MARKTSHLAAGPRNLSKNTILETAIDLMEEARESGFSLRKLGERVGCDPMAILYHFGNKNGLFRAMADELMARLETVDESKPWNERLRNHARQYRTLALGHPNTFGLTQRFLNTGISDFAHIEMVHRALADAGIPDTEAPAVCLAWYASVIGLCMGEIGGLIRPATEAETQEILETPERRYPHLHALAPAYRSLDPEMAFETASDILIQGIARLS